jgi:hypothetical protein
MQHQYIRFFESLVFCEFVNMIVRLGMSNSFVHVTQRFPVDGEPILDDDLGLGFGIPPKSTICAAKQHFAPPFLAKFADLHRQNEFLEAVTVS